VALKVAYNNSDSRTFCCQTRR